MRRMHTARVTSVNSSGPRTPAFARFKDQAPSASGRHELEAISDLGSARKGGERNSGLRCNPFTAIGETAAHAGSRTAVEPRGPYRTLCRVYSAAFGLQWKDVRMENFLPY